jgi:PEGA domain
MSDAPLAMTPDERTRRWCCCRHGAALHMRYRLDSGRVLSESRSLSSKGWFMRIAGLCLALLIGFVGVSGCATIMAGGPDRIPVSTNPPGATVFVDNMPVGTTPTMVALDRQRSGGVIRIEMAGFVPVTVVRAKAINGWFWANLCVGFVGFIVDLATAEYKSFDDGPIALGLTPAYGTPGAPPPPPPGPGLPPPAAPPR